MGRPSLAAILYIQIKFLAERLLGTVNDLIL